MRITSAKNSNAAALLVPAGAAAGFTEGAAAGLVEMLFVRLRNGELANAASGLQDALLLIF